MKNKMNQIYKKNIASFLIVLLLTMPFYLSSVFAQENDQDPPSQIEIPIPDPVESCLAKKVESDEFVEDLDSGPIKTLESIAATLYFTCTAWSTLSVIQKTYRSAIGTTDFCKTGNEPICSINSIEEIKATAVGRVMTEMCGYVECDTGKITGLVGLEGIDESVRTFTGLGPFDNIYTSIAFLCPVGILHNLRKLKTIYQVKSCCIEQACKNGINVESCERQFSEATCMYWEGSIYSSLIGIGIHLVSLAVAYLFADEVKELLEKAGSWPGLIKSLFGAYQHIQKLQSTFEWMSQTFSEPNCEDLNFDDIKYGGARRASSIVCNLIQVDLNGDGVFDRLEPRCS